jgi:uncharacterized GH25 family protein
MKKFAPLAALSLTLGSFGLAHDIALFPQLRGQALVVLAKYGHPGDYQPAIPGKLLDLTGYGPSGEALECAAGAQSEGDTLVANVASSVGGPGMWLFAARYDNGFFAKLPSGRTVNTTKLEAPDAASVTHNFKFGKALFTLGGRGKGYDRVVGHRLEIVPQTDPFALKPGDGFTVMVRFDGKPLSGAGVEIGDGVTPVQEDVILRFKTDSRGMAKLPIEKTGLRSLRWTTTYHQRFRPSPHEMHIPRRLFLPFRASARLNIGWSRQEATARLGVSQP